MNRSLFPVKPRDAASLLIVRKHRGEHQVLMGRRPAKDRFMPDVYVFPGGRVEPSDAALPAATELPTREVERFPVHVDDLSGVRLGKALDTELSRLGVVSEKLMLDELQTVETEGRAA